MKKLIFIILFPCFLFAQTGVNIFDTDENLLDETIKSTAADTSAAFVGREHMAFHIFAWDNAEEDSSHIRFDFQACTNIDSAFWTTVESYTVTNSDDSTWQWFILTEFPIPSAKWWRVIATGLGDNTKDEYTQYKVKRSNSYQAR